MGHGRVIKEKCSMSESYARKLRSVAVVLNTDKYPRFRELSISIREMISLKSRVEKMLQIPDLEKFWQGEG
jgi:hypothetical protein